MFYVSQEHGAIYTGELWTSHFSLFIFYRGGWERMWPPCTWNLNAPAKPRPRNILFPKEKNRNLHSEQRHSARERCRGHLKHRLFLTAVERYTSGRPDPFVRSGKISHQEKLTRTPVLLVVLPAPPLRPLRTPDEHP